jgi:hypothetical protein
MATLPTPEESARAILAIFKSKNARPGEVLIAGHVKMKFLTSGGRADDYAAGLKLAGEKGWLEPGPSDSIRLTDGGFGKM